MKKIIRLGMALALCFSLITFSGCGSAASLTRGVAPALLAKVGGSLTQNLTSLPGLGSLAGKLNMATKLSSIIKGESLVSGFKSMLSNKYQIPTQAVSDVYSKLTNLKSVAGFVAKNASSSILSGL